MQLLLVPLIQFSNHDVVGPGLCWRVGDGPNQAPSLREVSPQGDQQGADMDEQSLCPQEL